MTAAATTLEAVLAEQRAHLARLAGALQDLPPVGDHTDRWEADERELAIRRLRRYFVARANHLARRVLPLARRHLVDGSSLVREIVTVKRDCEEALIEMGWFDDRNPVQNELVRRIADRLDKLSVLETDMMSGLAGRLDPAEDAGVADRMRRGVTSRWSPTRPHPDLPASPVLSAVLAPLVALYDRGSDRLTRPVPVRDDRSAT